MEILYSELKGVVLICGGGGFLGSKKCSKKEITLLTLLICVSSALPQLPAPWQAEQVLSNLLHLLADG